MTIHDTIIDLTIPCETVTVQPPGAPQAPGSCPSTKYSGDNVTLQSTPDGGIGPYYVVFLKDDVTIDPSRLAGLDNPIIDAPEGVQITRVYSLNDLDISSAISGTLKFSVYIEDKCPIGSQSCQSDCIISVGCVAPVCNFTVT